MRVVCISDTHGLHDGLDVPEGDLLIHAGDLTSTGRAGEVIEARDFLAKLPHPQKIVIAGNHDFLFERDAEAAEAIMQDFVYLRDTEVEVGGLRVWGSPWQPWFGDWAFNLQRGLEIRAKWDLIPDDVDVLVTHGPPRGHGDLTTQGERVGCADLLDAVRRVRPRWHVFGHIHEGHGVSHDPVTTFINASICTVGYQPTNPAIVFDVS